MKRSLALIFLIGLVLSAFAAVARHRAPPRWMMRQIRADLSLADPRPLHPSQLDLVPIRDPIRSYGRFRIKNQRLGASLIRPHNRIVPLRFAFLRRGIEFLLKKYTIPDIDFLVCLEDECDRADLPAPVFTFAKNATLHEPLFLIPDYEALEGHVHILKNVKKGLAKYPWKKRRSQAIWRGGPTGALFSLSTFLSAPRSQLVSFSLRYPQYVDAKFAGWCEEGAELDQIREEYSAFFAKPTSVRGHLYYKYQILIDGNSAAYSRAYWQLCSKSLIFKIDSPNIQWYYGELIPYVHYLPVASDLHDLEEKIEWARTHDSKAREIALNAWRFSQKHLKKSDIYLYLALLLKEYAKVQKLTESESI